MNEYIDREKLLCLIKTMPSSPITERENRLINAFISTVRNFPAADVRPVCHGRWVKARGSWCTPGGDPVWECSECGKGRHVYGIEHGSYGADVADGQWVSCPNCGADMREPPKEETE